ncbi:H+ Antiporter protein [Mycolicibacterium phlei]|uniref:MFS transporter n=1 Tax=Mycobacteroides chelonae TaxID=1774 RepID=UPI000618B236|nr:MFS transporter [Mycobacteroides chelonae]VEG15794.1 H+ Antiporter protein [Mycolicibacterium phlei]AKC38478.1 hypothetical protein GR01_07765 [Mycobacteroides chelonae]ANB00874.1 hypothetical protein BB28_08245 [Mycobacteroides chelonae CCUG 47445]OLT75158.1 hypothetical protein BKG56_15390 [Mycobacteroides chelonae]ORV12806.1 hypothetical protein AWB96_15630 [Mycobacteroides chelonae]
MTPTEVHPGHAAEPRLAQLSAPAKIYLVAFTVTNAGVGGFTLAIGLTLFAATGSAAAFGIAVAAEYLLGLAGQLVGGSILDRLRLLPVALVCNTARGVAVLVGGAMVLATGKAAPAIIVFLLVSVLRPIYRSASFALVGRVCHTTELVRVNSIRFGLLQIAQLGGLAAVSGLNAIAGAPSALVGVSALFLLGSALLLRLRPHVQPLEARESAPQDAGSIVRSIIGPWRELGSVIRSVPTVIIHFAVGAIPALVTSISIVLVAPVNSAFNGGSLGIALLDGGETLGALGVVFFTRRAPSARLPMLLVASVILAGLGLAGVGISSSLAFATIAFMVLGLSAALGGSATDTMLQLRSEPQILGRIAIAQEFATSLLAVLFLPTFGVLATSIGFGKTALFYAAVLACVLSLVLLSLALFRSHLFNAPLAVTKSGELS